MRKIRPTHIHMGKPRAISLFSGCGGSDLGLQRSAYKIVWANDRWEPARETYRDNIRNPRIKTGDIARFKRFPRADLLAGSILARTAKVARGSGMSLSTTSSANSTGF